MPLVTRTCRIMSSSTEAVNALHRHHLLHQQHPLQHTPQEVVYRGQIVRVQVPQYYYSVGDDDFQILLERVAVGGRPGARSTPPNPQQPLTLACRSGQPSCCRQRRQKLPLAVVVDGSSHDCVCQTSLSSLSPESGASQTAAAAAAAAATHRGVSGGANLARCRSEPDLLLDDVKRGGSHRRAVTPGAPASHGDVVAVVDRLKARRGTVSSDTDTEYSSWMPAASVLLHDEIDDDDDHLQRNSLSSLPSHLVGASRTVVLRKNGGSFGFVLCGAKSRFENSSGATFTPTVKFPALQYLDAVEPDSVAAKAGLAAGDFLLEINGQDVSSASHHHTVQLIKQAGDAVYLKIITPADVSSNQARGSGVPVSPESVPPTVQPLEAPPPPLPAKTFLRQNFAAGMRTVPDGESDERRVVEDTSPTSNLSRPLATGSSSPIVENTRLFPYTPSGPGNYDANIGARSVTSLRQVLQPSMIATEAAAAAQQRRRAIESSISKPEELTDDIKSRAVTSRMPNELPPRQPRRSLPDIDYNIRMPPPVPSPVVLPACDVGNEESESKLSKSSSSEHVQLLPEADRQRQRPVAQKLRDLRAIDQHMSSLAIGSCSSVNPDDTSDEMKRRHSDSTSFLAPPSISSDCFTTDRSSPVLVISEHSTLAGFSTDVLRVRINGRLSTTNDKSSGMQHSGSESAAATSMTSSSSSSSSSVEQNGKTDSTNSQPSSSVSDEKLPFHHFPPHHPHHHQSLHLPSPLQQLQQQQHRRPAPPPPPTRGTSLSPTAPPSLSSVGHPVATSPSSKATSDGNESTAMMKRSSSTCVTVASSTGNTIRDIDRERTQTTTTSASPETTSILARNVSKTFNKTETIDDAYFSHSKSKSAVPDVVTSSSTVRATDKCHPPTANPAIDRSSSSNSSTTNVVKVHSKRKAPSPPSTTSQSPRASSMVSNAPGNPELDATSTASAGASPSDENRQQHLTETSDSGGQRPPRASLKSRRPAPDVPSSSSSRPVITTPELGAATVSQATSEVQSTPNGSSVSGVPGNDTPVVSVVGSNLNETFDAASTSGANDSFNFITIAERARQDYVKRKAAAARIAIAAANEIKRNAAAGTTALAGSNGIAGSVPTSGEPFDAPSTLGDFSNSSTTLQVRSERLDATSDAVEAASPSKDRKKSNTKIVRGKIIAGRGKKMSTSSSTPTDDRASTSSSGLDAVVTDMLSVDFWSDHCAESGMTSSSSRSPSFQTGLQLSPPPGFDD